MQEAIGWVLFVAMSYVAWRVYRSLRKGYRNAVAMRQEAFSNAVSDAVASGVAQALSAAVADATASASGGSVNVHIGDNLARLIADNYDDSMRPDTDESHDAIAGRSNVGSLSDSTRHGELASGRAIRRGIDSRPNLSSVRVLPTEKRR